MTDDNIGRRQLNRRRLLQLTGAGLGGLTVTGMSSSIASAETNCAQGPFERTYSGETVNISKIADRRVDHGKAEDYPPATEDAIANAEINRESDSSPQASGAQRPPSSGDLVTVGTEYGGIRDTALIEPPLQDPPYVGPSDSQIAVGRSKAVQAVNQMMAVFNQRSGELELRVPFERLFDPLITEERFATGEPIIYDPRLRYDPEADRFLLSVFYNHFPSWSGAWLLAVSDNSNPEGNWHLYRVSTYSGDWPDYARLGLDQDAIYLTASTIPESFAFEDFDEELAILDKEAAYDGADVLVNHFTGLLRGGPSSFLDFVVQPSFQPHAGGESGSYYLLDTQLPEDRLTLWTVTDPLDDPSLECASISVDPFSVAPPARQKGTDARVEIDGYRLLNLEYNNGSLWTAHAIRYDWTDEEDRPVAAIRWYEIDPVNEDVIQSGTYGEPGTSYYYPHIKSDGDQTLMVYDISGPETYPGIEVAGRTADHTDGEMEDTTVIKEGQSPMEHPTDNFGRRDPVWWQDYTGGSIHPQTGNFWVTAQYSPAFDVPLDGEEPDQYETYIAELRFDDGKGGR